MVLCKSAFFGRDVITRNSYFGHFLYRTLTKISIVDLQIPVRLFTELPDFFLMKPFLLLFWLIRSFLHPKPVPRFTSLIPSFRVENDLLPGCGIPAVILMFLREKAVVLWLTGKKSSFSCLADLLSGNPPIRKITSYVMPCMIPWVSRSLVF